MPEGLELRNDREEVCVLASMAFNDRQGHPFSDVGREGSSK